MPGVVVRLLRPSSLRYSWTVCPCEKPPVLSSDWPCRGMQIQIGRSAGVLHARHSQPYLTKEDRKVERGLKKTDHQSKRHETNGCSELLKSTAGLAGARSAGRRRAQAGWNSPSRREKACSPPRSVGNVGASRVGDMPATEGARPDVGNATSGTRAIESLAGRALQSHTRDHLPTSKAVRPMLLSESCFQRG